MALLLPNFAEEYIQVVMPLLQIYNIAAALTDDERLELAKHLHAITDILLKTDSK